MSSVMDYRSKHTSVFPELDRVYRSPGPCHILGSTILAQSLLTDPAIFTLKNSFEQPSMSPSSPVVTPKKQINPRGQNLGSIGILNALSQVISKSIAAPIERISLLMQCENEMLKYGHLSSPYKGMKDCLLRTIKNEGVLSLWRGNSMNVITPLTFEAVNFAIRRSRHDSTKLKDSSQRPPFWFAVLGLMSAMLLYYPLDYARTRLANDVKVARQFHFSLDSSGKNCSNAAGNRLFSGVFDVYRKALTSEGIIGLYRGYTCACVGVVAYYQLTTGIKSLYKTETQPKEQLTSSKLIAPVVLLSLPLAFHPVITICRRMMMTSGEATKYSGVADAVHQIVKHEGVSALYKGVAAHAIFILAKSSSALAFFYFTFAGLNQPQKKLSS